MVEATLDGIRRLSRDLRPSVLDDLGLVQAIDALTADLARRTNTKVSLEVKGEPRRLSGDAELALFRIAQEALRNVEWHSGAANAHVVLTYCPEALVVQITDDGSGFDLRQVLGEHGKGVPLGLIGMQERAKLVGGTLEIETRPSHGTKVTAEVKSSD
jgi:signal transduction histidine kinase